MQSIRNAMLKAQSEWLDRAENAETTTESTVSRVIAEAFQIEAMKYIVVTPEHDVDAHYDSAMEALANDTEVTHHTKG